VTVETLRLRAVVWTAVGATALTLPWTRKYCVVGRLGDTAAACATTVTAGWLAVVMLRRSPGWSRMRTSARSADYWPLLVIGACGEELLFRGLLLRAVTATWGAWPGILLAAGAFGVAHRRRGRSRDVAIHAFTGLILGALAWVTGGWLASAAAHATYNCVVVQWRRTPAAGAPRALVSEAR
jgi:membrane protease YdiL (CAAX protease family)